MLNLHCCTGFSRVVESRGHSQVAVRGLLITVASPVVEDRLSSCGTWAQLLHSMWNPLRPGIEPESPVLAGGFLTTEPPGKPCLYFLMTNLSR